ncbi:MAG TPA: Rieske 2Fe-2S domain-containing protein [Myxococcota bacterium]|nr:Rieske 2Fe-2S domain-containing protein [Myxococcota bacterium]
MSVPEPSLEPASRIAPPAERFPAYPRAWLRFESARSLRRGPVSRDFCGRRVVVYRTEAGALRALDARCLHLGSDLGRGRVEGDSIRCAFHGWRFDGQGRCTHIPAQAVPPGCPTLASYPVEERAGGLYVFNGAQARYPLPFFADRAPEELVPSRPYSVELSCPWFMVGSNAFDLQHFRAAHDRVLRGPAEVRSSHPFARTAAASFAVSGSGLRDGLTRAISGDEVRLEITDWCGSLLFATASFRRGKSYGLVAVTPLAGGRTRITVTVFVPKSAVPGLRGLLDAAHAAVRRFFILAFLAEDAKNLDGVRYNPEGLIEADRELAEYFGWLASISR